MPAVEDAASENKRRRDVEKVLFISGDKPDSLQERVSGDRSRHRVAANTGGAFVWEEDMFAAAAKQGIIGGILGTAVMTLGEKAEQAITGRPNSYVPGRTAARLFRLPNPDKDSTLRIGQCTGGRGRSQGQFAE